MNKVEVLIFFLIVIPTIIVFVVGRYTSLSLRRKKAVWKPKLVVGRFDSKVFIVRNNETQEIARFQNNAGNYDQLLLIAESEAMERCALLNSTRKMLG